MKPHRILGAALLAVSVWALMFDVTDWWAVVTIVALWAGFAVAVVRVERAEARDADREQAARICERERLRTGKAAS